MCDERQLKKVFRQGPSVKKGKGLLLGVRGPGPTGFSPLRTVGSELSPKIEGVGDTVFVLLIESSQSFKNGADRGLSLPSRV